MLDVMLRYQTPNSNYRTTDYIETSMPVTNMLRYFSNILLKEA